MNLKPCDIIWARTGEPLLTLVGNIFTLHLDTSAFILPSTWVELSSMPLTLSMFENKDILFHSTTPSLESLAFWAISRDFSHEMRTEMQLLAN